METGEEIGTELGACSVKAEAQGHCGECSAKLQLHNISPYLQE